jgi:transposase
MMHARRRFHEAYLIGGKKPGLAADALKMFKWIYDKEDSYKQKDFTPEQRKEAREKEIRPSLLAIKEWAESKAGRVPKSSPVGNALRYYINEFDELSAFLADGRYEIDNGWCERMIRKFAIGRNNWLFCDSVPGAHASSIFYSLMMTAKLNGKDPYKVMTEIFTKLPSARTADDYEVLTGLLLSPEKPLSCHKKEDSID